MTAIAKTLDTKMKLWRPSTARKVEKLVANIITLADQEPTPRKTARKSLSWNHDAFLLDRQVFHRPTPKDLAINHDRYLYGAK